MDLISKVGLQDPFYPKSIIVTTIEEIEKRLCCIEENCCDDGTGILQTNQATPNFTQIWSSVVNIQPVGSHNVIIGNNSLQGVTGLRNTAIGNEHMNTVTFPASLPNSMNTLLGFGNGLGVVGGKNTFVGQLAGTGTAIGGELLESNIAIGNEALSLVGNTTNNTALNIAIGESAMTGLATLSIIAELNQGNIAIGEFTASGMSGGTNTGNIAIGNRSLDNAPNPLNGNVALNIVVGDHSGRDARGHLANGHFVVNNIIIGNSSGGGYGSLVTTENVERNIIVGNDCLTTMTGLSQKNITIGDNIGNVLKAYSGDTPYIAIGNDIFDNPAPAGITNAGGSLIGIGSECLGSLITTRNAIVIGSHALDTATTIADVVAIGDDIAIGVPTLAGECVLLGNSVLGGATSGTAGNKSVIIGEQAASGVVTSGFTDAVIIGYQACAGNTGSLGHDSVIIGHGIDVLTTGTGGITTSNYVSINDAYRSWNNTAGPPVLGNWNPFIGVSQYDDGGGPTEPPDGDFKDGEISFYVVPDASTPTFFEIHVKYKSGPATYWKGIIGTLT